MSYEPIPQYPDEDPFPSSEYGSPTPPAPSLSWSAWLSNALTFMMFGAAIAAVVMSGINTDDRLNSTMHSQISAILNRLDALENRQNLSDYTIGLQQAEFTQESQFVNGIYQNVTSLTEIVDVVTNPSGQITTLQTQIAALQQLAVIAQTDILSILAQNSSESLAIFQLTQTETLLEASIQQLTNQQAQLKLNDTALLASQASIQAAVAALQLYDTTQDAAVASISASLSTFATLSSQQQLALTIQGLAFTQGTQATQLAQLIANGTTYVTINQWFAGQASLNSRINSLNVTVQGIALAEVNGTAFQSLQAAVQQLTTVSNQLTTQVNTIVITQLLNTTFFLQQLMIVNSSLSALSISLGGLTNYVTVSVLQPLQAAQQATQAQLNALSSGTTNVTLLSVQIFLDALQAQLTTVQLFDNSTGLTLAGFFKNISLLQAAEGASQAFQTSAQFTLNAYNASLMALQTLQTTMNGTLVLQQTQLNGFAITIAGIQANVTSLTNSVTVQVNALTGYVNGQLGQVNATFASLLAANLNTQNTLGGIMSNVTSLQVSLQLSQARNLLNFTAIWVLLAPFRNNVSNVITASQVTADITAQITALQSTIQSQLDTLTTTSASLSTSISILSANITTLQSLYNATLALIASNYNVLNAQIIAINGQLSTINGQIASNNSGQLTTINGQLVFLTAQLGYATGNLTVLQNSFTAFSTADYHNITTLQTGLASVLSNLTSVWNAISAINADLLNGVTQAQITSINNQIGTLNGQISAIQSSDLYFSSQINFLNGNTSQLNNGLASLTTTVNGISSNDITLTSTVNGLSSTVSGLTATVNGLTSTVNSPTIGNAALGNELSSLNTTVNGLATGLTTDQAAIAILQTNVTTLFTEFTGYTMTHLIQTYAHSLPYTTIVYSMPSIYDPYPPLVVPPYSPTLVDAHGIINMIMYVPSGTAAAGVYGTITFTMPYLSPPTVVVTEGPYNYVIGYPQYQCAPTPPDPGNVWSATSITQFGFQVSAASSFTAGTDCIFGYQWTVTPTLP